jgi:hypothetical protein
MYYEKNQGPNVQRKKKLKILCKFQTMKKWLGNMAFSVKSLKTTVKWVALLLQIQEIPGSDLSPEMVILTEVLQFSSAFTSKCGDNI